MIDQVKESRAGRAQRDAWKIKPPCELQTEPYCHGDCPYHGDCWPEEEDEEDE